MSQVFSEGRETITKTIQTASYPDIHTAVNVLLERWPEFQVSTLVANRMNLGPQTSHYEVNVILERIPDVERNQQRTRRTLG